MTVTETSSTQERRMIYVVTGIIVVVLVVIALLTFHSGKTSQQAEQKANQLIAALTAAGAHAPRQAQVVRVLGNDGGAVCDDPSGSLRKGIFLGQLVLKIYCPDKLPSFQEFVNGLNLGDNVKG